MSQILFRVHGLAKRFGRIEALRQVELELLRGKLTVFLGENGAGKTTTLKIILGFLFPDAGCVEKIYPELRLGYVPEQPAFFPWLKGREILHLTASTFGLSETEAKRKIEDAASLLSFELSQLDRRVRTYSHGNQKKMAYLQNLIIEPELLIVDEPFTALDPVAIKQVRDLFIKFKEAGKTVFISSHLISEAEKLADQVIIIKQGKTLFQIDWPEFVQERLYLKVKRGSPGERIILERWPDTRVSGDCLENFILKKDWTDIQTYFDQNLKETFPQEVQINKPDLESFFLFFTCS